MREINSTYISLLYCCVLAIDNTPGRLYLKVGELCDNTAFQLTVTSVIILLQPHLAHNHYITLTPNNSYKINDHFSQYLKNLGQACKCIETVFL